MLASHQYMNFGWLINLSLLPLGKWNGKLLPLNSYIVYTPIPGSRLSFTLYPALYHFLQTNFYIFMNQPSLLNY